MKLAAGSWQLAFNNNKQLFSFVFHFALSDGILNQCHFLLTLTTSHCLFLALPLDFFLLLVLSHSSFTVFHLTHFHQYTLRHLHNTFTIRSVTVQDSFSASFDYSP